MEEACEAGEVNSELNRRQRVKWIRHPFCTNTKGFCENPANATSSTNSTCSNGRKPRPHRCDFQVSNCLSVVLFHSIPIPNKASKKGSTSLLLHFADAGEGWTLQKHWCHSCGQQKTAVSPHLSVEGWAYKFLGCSLLECTSDIRLIYESKFWWHKRRKNKM